MSKHHHHNHNNNNNHQNQTHQEHQANASNGIESFPLVRTNSMENLNSASSAATTNHVDETLALIVNPSLKA